MPNDHNLRDRQLSELLEQAEPPKSPDHLDESILSYARDNVPDGPAKSPWQFFFNGTYWLNQHWVTALTTVSVAVIAVSISLQNLNTNSEPASFSMPASSDLQEVALNRELAEATGTRQEQASTPATDCPVLTPPGAGRRPTTTRPCRWTRSCSVRA